MADHASNCGNSDDDVVSPFIGKRPKLEDSVLPISSNVKDVDKNQFSSFLLKEKASVLANCKNCLAELFFLENGNLLDFFLWQEGALANSNLQRTIEDFEQSLSNPSCQPSPCLKPMEVAVDGVPMPSQHIELPGADLPERPVSSLAQLPTNIAASEPSPRSSATSPVRNRLLSPISVVASLTGSPSRASCSPLSPSRRVRHVTAELIVSEPVAAEQSNLVVAQVGTPQPSFSPAAPSVATVVKDIQESAAERAKHEAEVLRRVAELQREGLWSAKRLPRCAEPIKPKCHWDSLLEEMAWMSTDFAEEKRWKKAVAKKVATAVCRHIAESGLGYGCTEIPNENDASSEDIAIKTCRSIAMMIEEFWTQMLRLASWRIESRLAEKHKRERDMHLDFIVGQTEKFSSWLSEGLMQPISSKASDGLGKEKPPSETANLISLPEELLNDSEDSDDSADKEFVPHQEDMDDEETIAHADEVEGEEAEKEVDALRAEAEMGVDDLLASLPPEYLSQLGFKGAVSDSRKQPETSVDSKESSAPASCELTNDDKETCAESADSTARKERLDKLAAEAWKMQPCGASETTRTIIPFLLRGGDLREYQRVGLDWLVMLHEKRINGILADEMGLGKTIMTISLLAHLACAKGIWGPHIIIVPASVLLNWEMELKRWLPAFKVLTYYGSVKERKEKRRGWSEQNSFHVCITSYQLAVIDQGVLRRRHWQYLILDEAQNIKNFRSRRWQALLSFQSQHRILLTGTPLQNSLMELWSLMHFLMPQLFQSSDDFRDWFANPLASMVEGDREFSDNLVHRLHKVLRPFLLRRLKKDVERQLPSKIEHIVPCRLSRRQRFLYDDFMSRATTKAALAGGQFVSVLGVLVQLRKVCNHPDLFEPRPVLSSLVIPDPIVYSCPSLFSELNCMSQQSLEWLIGEQQRQPSLCGIHVDRVAELCPSQQAFYDMYTTCGTGETTRNEKLSALTQRRIRLQAFRSLAGDIPIASDVKTHSMDLVNGFGCKTVGRLLPTTELCPPTVVYPLKLIDTQSAIATVGSVSGQEQKPFLEICGRLNVTDSAVIASPPVEVIQRVCTEENETALFLAKLNEQRCRLLATRPLYGTDLLRSVTVASNVKGQHWCNVSNHLNLDICVDENALLPILQLYAFSLYPVIVKTPEFHSKLRCVAKFTFGQTLLPKPDASGNSMSIDKLQHAVGIRKLLNFPELRLIQYDCGKLQALNSLLRSLKSNDHRVLIFTQMSRMLDVLEQFLSYHGHTYLRLDGSTRLENRQVMVERFNQDKRIFCFILSTRAGGLGINLTGADTVIFYDSDWNPTTDAQAQDRCHRIGQTRDVHIYRLVSERTVEENVIKRAAQKRLLNELAIEGGDFTTARLRENALRDIFGASTLADIGVDIEQPSTTPSAETSCSSIQPDKTDDGEPSLADIAPPQQISALEEALLQAEGQCAGDEADVVAAREARKEQVAENADNDFFLETDLPAPGISSEQPSVISVPTSNIPSDVTNEVVALEQQLRPVERLALDIVERLLVTSQQQQDRTQLLSEADTGSASRGDWELENLKAAQLDLVKKANTFSDESSGSEMDDESGVEQMDVTNISEFSSELALTYDRNAGQAWIDEWSGELMPIWLPPTPSPSDFPAFGTIGESIGALLDEFCEGCMCSCDDYSTVLDCHSLSNSSIQLYHAVPMFESELPPVCLEPPAAVALSRIRAAVIAASPPLIRSLNAEDAAVSGTHRVPGENIVTDMLADQVNLSSTALSQEDAPKRKSQSSSRTKRAAASLADDCPAAPRSLFERPTGAMQRIREDMRHRRSEITSHSNILFAGKAEPRSHQSLVEPVTPHFSLTSTLPRFNSVGNDWLISEEWGILLALSNLMDVPTSLTPVQPGHIANWDAIADFISSSAVGPFRSGKSCRQHYDSVILPREDPRQQNVDNMSMMSGDSGRPTPPPAQYAAGSGRKKGDKRRQQMADVAMPTTNSSERTAALNAQDGGTSVTNYHMSRFTSAIEAINRFSPHCPHVPSSKISSTSRPFATHCPLLADIDWDNAMMPVDVAAHRLAARQSRRIQHYQIQQHHQPHSHFTGGSASAKVGSDVQISPLDSGTPQPGRALSDLVKPRNSINTSLGATSALGSATVLSSSTGATVSSLVDSLLISTPPMATPPSVVLSHPYNQQQQQQQQQQIQPQQSNQQPIVRQQSIGTVARNSVNGGGTLASAVSTSSNRSTPLPLSEGSSVTRLLSAPSPSLATGASITPASGTPSATVFASRGAILSPAPSASVVASSASSTNLRQAATPTARLQLMPTTTVAVASTPVTRVGNAANAVGSAVSVGANGSNQSSTPASTGSAAPSQQVAQLRLQVAASAAQAALNRSSNVTSATSGNSTSTGGNGEVVSVVVTGTAASGNTFTTGGLRGTPVEALLRRSPTVLPANAIRASHHQFSSTAGGGMRHIAQLLPQSATGFITVQQSQQQQASQQPSQIVLSNAGATGQSSAGTAATIVLSAAGPTGGAHAYSQFRSSPQPRPGLTALRYGDSSGISSVRLAGGASVSTASVVSSPLRQQITSVRPNASVLTVATAIPAPSAALAASSSTSTATTVTTSVTTTSLTATTSGQQQASPPVHLVATHQLPSTQPTASSSTPTLSNALTGGRVSLPSLTLGNTTSRLQQQLDAPNVVVSSDDEGEDNTGGGTDDDNAGEAYMQSVAIPPSRGRPPTRRLQRGGGTTRGSTRGGAANTPKQQAYRRH